MNATHETSALLTDLYQLTMLQAYHHDGMAETAVFEFLVRDLPPGRGFLLAAGLEPVLEYLENLHFTAEDIAWLRETGHFSSDFLESLQRLRFTGSVNAVPEGTPVFPGEPILQVIAPLPEAQLVETRIINLMHFQTLIASKAIRLSLAAPEAAIVDFGFRRAHGAEAGLLAARAGYLAGLAGTATVLAGQRYRIPLYGTMAHAYVQSFDDEAVAFERFARTQPGNVVLLIDTYDVARAAQRVVDLAPRLAADGIRIRAVRLDSGDLAAQAHSVRGILDAGGLSEVGIFASGSLDEYALADLQAANAPITGYGVGTRLDTSADAPYLDCAYKLQEYAGQPRRKRSEGKATWPGRKQIYRRFDGPTEPCTGSPVPIGTPVGDTLTLNTAAHAGEPLLHPVMEEGRRLQAAPELAVTRAYAQRAVAALPESLRRLDRTGGYPVEVAEAIHAVAARLDRAN